MAHLSIKVRLIGSFILLSLAMLSLAASSLMVAKNEHDAFKHHVDVIAKKTALVGDIHAHSGTRAIAARNMVIAASQQAREAARRAAISAHASVEQAHAALAALTARTSISPQEKQLLQELADIEHRYGAVALAIVELAAKGQTTEASMQMNQECMPLLGQLDDVIKRLASLSKSTAEASMAESDAQAKTNVAVLAGLALAACGLSGFLAWSMPRSILRPIEDASRLARAVAEGDLTSGIATNRTDELGQLLHTLNHMRTSLSDLVVQVRRGSDGIRHSSAEISSGNNDLSRRTEAQSSSLQQTAAAMEQMTTSVQQSAQTASEVNVIAIEARESAHHGGALVKQVVSTMDDITESSRRISEIIGTIDGIAFQTNILALNAAVEAARAGEQGRGFAVVASEVRSLAQRSSDAAKQIRNLISDSVARVGAGSELVGNAGLAMKEIVEKVEKVSSLIQAINQSSAEQNDGIQQVNRAVAVLDQGTYQNAALVEQSANAAESLNAQAEDLYRVVNLFKLSHPAL